MKPFSRIFCREFPGLALALALALAGVLPPAARAASASEKNAAPTRAEVSEKKTDLKELREQIEALRKEMAAAEGQRADWR